MKTLFSVFTDPRMYDRIMFFDDDRTYRGKDIIRMTFLCRELLCRHSGYEDFTVATDNSASMQVLMFAGWLLGKNVIQPNTLQAEGFRVFDSHKTLCVFSEAHAYSEAFRHFSENAAGDAGSVPALLDLSRVFDEYRRSCMKSVGWEGVKGELNEPLSESPDAGDDGGRPFTAECARLIEECLSEPDFAALAERLGIKIPSPSEEHDFIRALAGIVTDPKRENGLCITGLTSGSTGIPKRVPRTLGDFYREIACVKSFIRPDYADRTAGAATVTNFHAYGVLFRFLLPVISEIPVYVSMLEYQEQFDKLKGLGRSLFLISNPGFFKRLDSSPCPVGVKLMMSAGGRLAPDVLRRAVDVYGAPLLEIYGSTETGVMGYRYPVTADEDWSVPEASAVETVDAAGKITDGEGLIRITAPHVNGGIPYTGSDVIRLTQRPDGRQGFRLLGRSDRIIKLEDNRVSLDELEKAVSAHEFVKECAVVRYEQKNRDFIGALLVLSEKGKEEYACMSSGRFFIRLRNDLGRVMIKLAVPRRFIIADALPLTDSRKTAYGKIERYFYHESA